MVLTISPLDADGAFSFETALKNGSDYHVTVLVQPDGQTCNVSNGSGSVKKDVTEAKKDLKEGFCFHRYILCAPCLGELRSAARASPKTSDEVS